MKKNLFFIVLAILLLTPWPVAYAYNNNAMASQGPVLIEAAPSSVAPHMQVFGKAIGGVTAGDLFYVDSANSTADIPVTLYITNTDELIHYYRYLTLRVNVYVQTGAEQWERVADNGEEFIPETYITMQNGQVSFTLPGYARYKVAIDGGCFYNFSVPDDKDKIMPRFHLTAEL